MKERYYKVMVMNPRSCRYRDNLRSERECRVIAHRCTYGRMAIKNIECSNDNVFPENCPLHILEDEE